MRTSIDCVLAKISDLEMRVQSVQDSIAKLREKYSNIPEFSDIELTTPKKNRFFTEICGVMDK